MIHGMFKWMLMPSAVVLGIWLAVLVFMDFKNLPLLNYQFGIGVGIAAAVVGIVSLVAFREDAAESMWGGFAVLAFGLLVIHVIILVYLVAIVKRVDLAFTFNVGLFQKIPIWGGTTVWLLSSAIGYARSCCGLESCRE